MQEVCEFVAVEEEACFMATCSVCGATHVVDFDPSIADFMCSQIAAPCEGEGGADVVLVQVQQPSGDDGGLSPTERKSLVDRYFVQADRATAHSVAGREDRVMSQTRYLNNEVVSRKGERFLVEDPLAALRPDADCRGTLVGGIIGSHKLGRRGLGFKKRPQAEVNKVQLSTAQRTRLKKPAGCTFSGQGPHLVHAGFRVP